MMRQESPSPNSTLSNSALAAAKPPTPTSSPKLRRRTISGGSGDQTSIVRQHLDVESDLDEKSNVKSKRTPPAGRRDSPSELFPPSPSVVSGLASGIPGVPVVHDKRRSSAGPEHTQWSERGIDVGASPQSSPSKSKSAGYRRKQDDSEAFLASPTRLEGNKCVKRTQSLKEQLVKKFSTVFTQSKNSSTSSSPPVNQTSSTSVSPTTAVENLKPTSMATSANSHAQPVISGSRRSRIPQPTQVVSGGGGAVVGNGCLEHDIDTYKAELSVNEHHAPLYSPRQFLTDEIRSSDEQIPISFDVNSMGNQLRIVKDQEATPFRSHTVDRCGVVVPTGPTSNSSKGLEPESERGRQTSPNTTDSNGSLSGKKTSPPRVIGFEKLSSPEYQKSLSFTRHKMSRQRPGSLRHNVQVLPDKKLLREKANSNENLSSAANDLQLGETFSLSSMSQNVSPVPTVERVTSASANPTTTVNLVPRPPMIKRPSTDSDDNSATESDYSRVTGSNPNNGSNASLPPRGRLGIYPKVKKGSGGNNSSTNGSSGSSSALPSSGTAGPQDRRSAPILIGGNASRRDSSPTIDHGSILLLSARPDDSSDNESLNDDAGGGNTSDGDLSPKGSTSGTTAGERSLPGRQKSSSLEVLCVENPTVPKIHKPSARLSSRGHPVPGSPPKSVTWNLVPDVKNYDNDSLTPHNGENAENGPSSSSASSSSRHHHHHHHRHRSEIPFSYSRHHHTKMRHAASDERLFESRKGIANSTLIAVHESFLEQMTMLLKEEMQLLEEVKQEKKSMTVYREVMQKILSIKAKTVKQMQDILEQSDV